MKLIYGRQLLVDLKIKDIGDYGFDTIQLENMHSTDGLAAVTKALETPDDFFNPDPDFVLSIDLFGDSRCGENSDSREVGCIERDSWYDSTSNAFYHDWGALFELVDIAYGDRFKGVRWNHEYKPAHFKEGSKWAAYARVHCRSDYDYVQANARTEWEYFLANVAMDHSRDAYLNEGKAAEAPYTTAKYLKVRAVYPHFVDFQVKAQARMVDILCQELGTSHTFIIYPAQRTGHVHTVAEYTLNTNLVTASNAVREIATWDLYSYNNSVRDDLANDQGSRKYFFVIQQGRRDLEPKGGESEEELKKIRRERIGARKDRIQAAIENCLDPGEGEDPWGSSFAFWNKWRNVTADDDDSDDYDIPVNERITKAEQKAYMDEVAEALNEED